jgi:hypothetical protein
LGVKLKTLGLIMKFCLFWVQKWKLICSGLGTTELSVLNHLHLSKFKVVLTPDFKKHHIQKKKSNFFFLFLLIITSFLNLEYRAKTFCSSRWTSFSFSRLTSKVAQINKTCSSVIDRQSQMNHGKDLFKVLKR